MDFTFLKRSPSAFLIAAVALSGCGSKSEIDVQVARDHVDAGRANDATPAGADSGGDRSAVFVPGPSVEVANDASCVVAAREGRVYFVSLGAGSSSTMLMSAAPSGGAPSTLAVLDSDVSSLAVESDFVYLGHGRRSGSGLNQYDAVVSKVPVNGGPPTTVATLTRSASSLAVRGAELFITTSWRSTFDPNDQKPMGAVLAVSTSGGAVRTLSSGLEEATSAVAHDARVYWAEFAGAGCSWGCVMAVPIAGGNSVVIASNANTTQVNIPATALDDDTVYWTNAGLQGTVASQPLSGNTRSTLASGLMEPRAVAVDEGNVYFTAAGAVMRVAKGGGPVTTVASPKCRPCGLAVDGGYAYWVACGVLTATALSAR